MIIPPLKCISLHQPWATGVALGVKGNETRGRRTSHRGDLAIHAAKCWEPYQRAFAEQERAHGTISFGLPFGAIIAIVEVRDIFPSEMAEFKRLSEQELRWGDYSPNRWAWELGNVRRLSEPVPCRGMQGMWTLDPQIAELVCARAA